MEYNSSRPRLIIPEYGRNVQKMVDYLFTLEDREERNKQAQNLIDIIGNLNPQIRDTPDFKHKLWDHLFIMSNFELDVDSPYPIPDAQHFVEPPQTVPYTQTKIRYRYYGKMVEDMIEECVKLEEGEAKEALKMLIANQMKKCYLQWNKDTVDDQTILQHIKELSGGKIEMPADTELTNNFNFASQKGGSKNKTKNNKKKRRN